MMEHKDRLLNALQAECDRRIVRLPGELLLAESEAKEAVLAELDFFRRVDETCRLLRGSP